MALLESQLRIKRSGIPGTGKGLYTTNTIPKGTRIVEYKGKIKTWKQITESDWNNRYILYITRNHVIDAQTYMKAYARYANDAEGLHKAYDLKNNAIFVNDKKRIFIEASRNIPAGAEIFVSYGKEYWDALRGNQA